MDSFLEITKADLIPKLLEYGIRFLIAALVIFIGFKLTNLLSNKVIPKLLAKRDADDSIVTFLTSLTKISLKVLTVITAMTHLGLEMTSFVALLGAAGIGIGMAFSGTLSNFAGGVIILMIKPFKIGDYIKTQGEEGTVKKILVFNTVLSTIDNKVVYLANGAVANNSIVNYTQQSLRRIDFVFGIAYGDDLKAAKETLKKFSDEDVRILKKPEVYIGLAELADSAVNIKMMVWVKTEDYWNVFYDINERVYQEFGQAGLSFPYPQMDVHLQKMD